MAKKKKPDFDEWIQDLMRFAEFKKEREQITLMPNCYKILTTSRVVGRVGIGNITKTYVVAGKSGNTIAEFGWSMKDISCDSKFLSLIGSIFDCEINVDENTRFVSCKDKADLECEYVFVPIEQLFPYGVICPFCIDKEDEALKKDQLFYYTFVEGDQSTIERVYSSKIFGEAYEKLLKANNRTRGEFDETIYILFHRDYIELSPVVYLTNSDLLRPLPVLYGADFTSSVVDNKDNAVSLSCKADKNINEFCRYWRGIKRKSGAIISREWYDFAKILEYSRFSKEEA